MNACAFFLSTQAVCVSYFPCNWWFDCFPNFLKIKMYTWMVIYFSGVDERFASERSICSKTRKQRFPWVITLGNNKFAHHCGPQTILSLAGTLKRNSHATASKQRGDPLSEAFSGCKICDHQAASHTNLNSCRKWDIILNNPISHPSTTLH
jgi:hypothetical protein